MKFAFLVLLTVFAVLLEPILSFELSHTSVRPNLLLVPMVVAVVRWPGPPAVVWGGVIGLICDCLAGSALGPRMAIFSLLSAAGTFSLPRRHLVAIEVLVCALGVAFTAELLLSWIANWQGNPIPFAETAGRATKTSLATAVLIGSGWLAAELLTRLLQGRRFGAARALSIGHPSKTN